MMYYFIVNPKSRTGKGMKEWELIKPVLKERGIRYQRYFTHFEFHAIKIARQICLTNPGPKTIVILGGDGTVNEVINGIPDFKDVTIGYIPSGSSNDFARSLGIPSDPLKALDRILEGGQIRKLDYDIISLNGRTRRYAGSAGIGYDAAVCKEVAESPVKKLFNKLKLGKLVYIVIAVKQILTTPLCRFRIRIDNEEQDYENTFFVAPMNQPYEGGGIKMSPAAKMDDHRLTACIIYKMSRIKLLFLMPSAYFGKQFLFSGTRQADCRRLEIHAEKKLPVHADGEYIGSTDHIVFEVAEDHLNLIV